MAWGRRTSELSFKLVALHAALDLLFAADRNRLLYADRRLADCIGPQDRAGLALGVLEIWQRSGV